MSKLTPGPKTKHQKKKKSQKTPPWMTNERTHTAKFGKERKERKRGKKEKTQEQDRFRSYCRCFRDTQRLVR